MPIERNSSTLWVARLPGSDPDAGAVVLTANYDGLGYVPNREPAALRPGADENASGCAALLELAAALSSGEPPKRSGRRRASVVSCRATASSRAPNSSSSVNRNSHIPVFEPSSSRCTTWPWCSAVWPSNFARK